MHISFGLSSNPSPRCSDRRIEGKHHDQIPSTASDACRWPKAPVEVAIRARDSNPHSHPHPQFSCCHPKKTTMSMKIQHTLTSIDDDDNILERFECECCRSLQYKKNKEVTIQSHQLNGLSNC